jgi:hypothetical protein
VSVGNTVGAPLAVAAGAEYIFFSPVFASTFMAQRFHAVVAIAGSAMIHDAMPANEFLTVVA